MATKEEVNRFLREFKTKLKIWDIIYRDDRGKNTETLLQLEITPHERKKIIENIETRDYSEGPLEEKLYGGSPMWIFGKMVKKQEVYIKITMGKPNNSVICISFHIAEYPMNYPLKEG